MSAKIINYVDWPAENGIIALLCCDTVSELPAVSDFPTFGTLAPTSTCKVIDTDEVYQLNTVGVWKIKQQATSVALDLSGYFTSEQSDQRYMRSGTGTTVPDGTDLDTLTNVGTYRNGNANNGCTNMPNDWHVPFRVVVENTYNPARVRQTWYGGQAATVSAYYYRTQYTSGGVAVWSSWYKVEGTPI